MASDDIYASCLPILKDESLEDEDRTEKLEDFVRAQHKLSGKALEAAVLDTLWRYRNSTLSASSPQHTIRKSRSPAPWQQPSRSATPVGRSPRSATASPAPASAPRPSLLRMKSGGGSPFTSPKPSPRFAFAAPNIPHSPSLDTYAFSTGAKTPDIYGNYGSENVDWLVNEDGGAHTPGEAGTSGYNAHQTVEMSPYDMIRSVLREDKPDDVIEKVLEENGYDLSVAITAFMDSSSPESSFASPAPAPQQDRTYLVGKSMAPTRPRTPQMQKSPIVCRYWLSTGQCLRADCKFSHDLSQHLCK